MKYLLLFTAFLLLISCNLFSPDYLDSKYTDEEWENLIIGHEFEINSTRAIEYFDDYTFKDKYYRYNKEKTVKGLIYSVSGKFSICDAIVHRYDFHIDELYMPLDSTMGGIQTLFYDYLLSQAGDEIKHTTIVVLNCIEGNPKNIWGRWEFPLYTFSVKFWDEDYINGIFTYLDSPIVSFEWNTDRYFEFSRDSSVAEFSYITDDPDYPGRTTYTRYSYENNFLYVNSNYYEVSFKDDKMYWLYKMY